MYGGLGLNKAEQVFNETFDMLTQLQIFLGEVYSMHPSPDIFLLGIPLDLEYVEQGAIFGTP